LAEIHDSSVTTRPFHQRFLVALAYREFRHLWAANASAQAAAWALIVSRGWLVFEETESSLWVGVTTFAAMAPQFLIPPIAGVLADRMDRRILLAWTYALNLATSAVLLLLAIVGGLEVWVIIALSTLNGVGRAAQLPVSQAAAASLVPKEHLLNALSLNASTQHGSRLIGPGLVTPMLSLLGAPAAFLTCTVLYGIGLVQILALTPRPPDRRVSQEGVLANFGRGLNYVYMRPLLRFVILIALFHCALTMAFESLMPSFSHDRLGAGAEGFGTLLVGVGAGSLVASFLVAGIQTSQGRGNTLLAMGLLSGLGQVLLSLTTSLLLATLAAALMGGAQAAFMTMTQATTQSMAAEEFRGRVASINTFSLGGAMAIMNLANGSLASLVGARDILLVDGLAFTAIVLLSLLAVSGRLAYGRDRALETQPALAQR
jgi:MFS family permease